ncbi:MAG: nitroreductase [Candidatus Poriferisodalaceae bacterium]|jgi:nitroreductase
MDALTALRNKRDTRSYTTDAVDDEVLGRVLDAARMAGSAKNVQPVRLVVTTDSAAKVALKDSGDFASWIDLAPVVIVVTVAGDAGPRRMFDVGRHAQNLMVAAFAEGLATCPVTIHHADVARSVLGIPAEVEPAMIVTLGWPAAGGEAPPQIAGPRIDMSSYVNHGSWSA